MKKGKMKLPLLQGFVLLLMTLDLLPTIEGVKCYQSGVSCTNLVNFTVDCDFYRNFGGGTFTCFSEEHFLILNLYEFFGKECGCLDIIPENINLLEDCNWSKIGKDKSLPEEIWQEVEEMKWKGSWYFKWLPHLALLVSIALSIVDIYFYGTED